MAFELNRTISWAGAKNSGDDLAFLKDLQANILKGHGRKQTVNLFLQFQGPAAAAALRVIGAQVTSAYQQLQEWESFKAAKAAKKKVAPRGPFVGLLLSQKGYEKLGLKAKAPDGGAFRNGLSVSNPFLTGTQFYEPYWRQEVHGVIIVGGGADALQAKVAFIKGQLGPQVLVVGEEAGAVMRNSRGDGIEHFGYADGRSKPLVIQEDIDAEKAKGGVDWLWNPTTEMSRLVKRCPGGDGELAFGSYFVFAKLEQNVDEFLKAEKRLADDLGLAGKDRKRAGAMVIGRFRDGTPLVLQGTDGLSNPIPNNFNYQDDIFFKKCPLQAHTRKVNDRVPSLPAPIFRRGIPYGNRAKFRRDRPRTGVGLLFFCCQSSIEDQFERVVKDWALNVDFPHGGVGQDAVFGTSTSQQEWPVQWGSAERKAVSVGTAASGAFVVNKGGEYFFAPSISFLKALT